MRSWFSHLPEMSYLIHGAIILIVLYLIGRKQPEKEIFYLTVGLKILAGIALGLIYYQKI